MTTFNTGNPIGSTDARDLSDNAENFDKALNSTDETWNDRLGVTRDTFEGALSKLSFYRVGTFAAGYTLTNMRQTLEYSGHEYSWAGTFPKVVSAGSTPATSGGIGAGAWVDRTQDTLRSELIAGGSSIEDIAGLESATFNVIGNFITTKQFGILSVEDGATDPTTEKAKWELMRVAAENSNALVIVGAGTYVLPPAVNLKANNSVWHFLKGSLLKLWDTQATTNFIEIPSPTNQIIRGLRFDANQAMQDTVTFGIDHVGCVVVDAKNFTMEDTYIVSSPSKGLGIVSSVGGTTSDVTIRGVRGGNCDYQAVIVDGNNMQGFFERIVIDDIQIGATGHAGLAINDGVHNTQVSNVNCDVQNTVWDAVFIRDSWDLQLNNIKGKRGRNGVQFMRLNGDCKRIVGDNIIGSNSSSYGVLFAGVFDSHFGTVVGINNVNSGIGVTHVGSPLVRSKQISIANPVGYDNQNVNTQQYGLRVFGCNSSTFGKGNFYGNTVRGKSILRSVCSNIDTDVLQSVAVTTGSVPANGGVIVTATFPEAFEDVEYDVFSSVEFSSSYVQLAIGHVTAKVAGSVSVFVRNLTATAQTGTLVVNARRRV